MRPRPSALIVTGLAWAVVSSAWAQTPMPPVERVRQAKTAAEALAMLGATNAELGRRVLLEAPDLALAGSRAAVRVVSRLPGTDLIVLVAERTERGEPPVVELLEFPPGDERVLEAVVPVAQPVRLRAVVRASGRMYSVTREIKPVQDGWPR